MNFPVSESDFLAVMSEYAKLITGIKLKIKRLNHDIKNHTNNYIMEINNLNAKETEEPEEPEKSKESKEPKEPLEIGLQNLHAQLRNFEFINRAAVLRMFFYFSNYLYILRPPIRGHCEHHRKLPVHNIEFPTIEKNEVPKSLLKDLSKLKRKKSAIKIDTCG